MGKGHLRRFLLRHWSSEIGERNVRSFNGKTWGLRKKYGMKNVESLELENTIIVREKHRRYSQWLITQLSFQRCNMEILIRAPTEICRRRKVGNEPNWHTCGQTTKNSPNLKQFDPSACQHCVVKSSSENSLLLSPRSCWCCSANICTGERESTDDKWCHHLPIACRREG